MLCFIYDYQTLIAGILALFAALLTIWKMHDIETTKRRKKNKAAKAMLSHGLSSICDYTKQTAEWLNELHKLNSKYGAKVKDQLGDYPPIPKLPENIYSWISDSIEFSDNDDAEKSINTMAGDLQVHIARLRGIKETYTSPNEILQNDWINQIIFQAVEIYSRASDILGYTRDDNLVTFKKNITFVKTVAFLNIYHSNADLAKMVDDYNSSIE